MSKYQHLVIWLGIGLVVFRFLTTSQRQALRGWIGSSKDRAR